MLLLPGRMGVLQAHRDSVFIQWECRGLIYGFPMGFWPEVQFRSGKLWVLVIKGAPVSFDLLFFSSCAECDSVTSLYCWGAFEPR